MTFREKSINKLHAFAMAAVFALVLAGCGGGGGGTATTPPDETPMPSPQEMCVEEKGAGSMVVDGVCYSAAENNVRMCVAGGGRDNGDGTCTSAAELAAAAAAATKAASTKSVAIAVEAAQTTAAGLGGTNAAGVYTLDISRKSMDPATVEINVPEDTTTTPATPAMKFTRAPMDLGAGNSMHVLDRGMGVEEVAIVSTDIKAPELVDFEDVVNAAGTPLQTLTTGTLSITDTSGLVTNRAFANVGGPDAAAPGGVRTVTYTDDTDTDDVDERKFTGTYNGAAGEYVCTGTNACTTTTNDKGVVTAMGGTWTFEPEDGAKSYQENFDYLYYGVWLKRTTADGAVTYNEVETFAGADTSVPASGDVSNVLGQATYEGGATGVYVKNVSATDLTSGHFTADVTLNATFGQTAANSIPPNMLNTLTGTIDKFMLSGGEANNWSVTLQSDGDPATAGIQPDADGVMAGTAKGGVGNGSFTATYHGSVTAGTDGTVPQPGSVVGEFNAGFPNGSVAGGFGARKMMDE